MGVGYGIGAVLAFGFTPVQGALAAFLTWIAGMLPDLDSESGKPVREIFGVTAALAPLILMQHLHEWGGDTERVMLFCLILYGTVRYGGAGLLGWLSVHRGMFHSIPAMLIAAEAAFLCYSHHDVMVRLLMAGGVGLGFLSHLLLDEMYSVRWDGARIRLAKSAGSAMKFAGRNFAPNAITWGLLFFLTYAVLVDAEFLDAPGTQPAPELIREALQPDEAPLYR